MASAVLLNSSPKLLHRILHLPPALRRALYSTTTSSSSPEIYDLVCVGGGPAGLSLLSALRTEPSAKRLKVALIDSQDLTSPKAPPSENVYSNRCSSLTPVSVGFLKQVEAWEHISNDRVQNYHGMEVWDGVSGAKISFDPLDAQQGLGVLDAVAEMIPGSHLRESSRKYELNGEDSGAVATMCENQNLTSALLKRLDEATDVEIMDKTKVESIALGPEPRDEKSLDLSQWPVITLPNSRRLAARLLIGADGANSPVRNFADISADGWDYGQHGVVATLQLDQSFSDLDLRTAYQRFLPTGPIALLPLPGNNASLVWSISTPLASKLKSLTPASFAQMVNAAFRLQVADLNYILEHIPTLDVTDELSWRLPNTPPSSTGQPTTLLPVISVQEGSIASFPLRMRHASTYTGHRVALIGDAAHTIHPLAGQGLNLGLADAKSLASRITYGLEHGMDIGSSWCLDGYNGDRWAANNAVMGVCDKLQKLYSVSSGPIVGARSLGLGLVDKLGPLKGIIMGAAGGGR